MFALARSAEEVFGPGVRVRVTDEQHDPRYGRTRGRKLLTGPIIAVPCQSISTLARPKPFAAARSATLLTLRAQPKLALELVDHERIQPKFLARNPQTPPAADGRQGYRQPARRPKTRLGVDQQSIDASPRSYRPVTASIPS